jgi:Copper type II ascorbate-dependent monooxygenase, C-terminal domain
MRTTSIGPVGAFIALALAACSETGEGAPGTCTPGVDCVVGPDGGQPGMPGFTPTPTPGPGPLTPSPSPSPTPSATSDIPCEVQAVLNASCNSCHAAGASAGSTLASRADFLRPSKRDPSKTVAVLSRERIASTEPGVMMPPAGYTRLEAAQQTVLDAWLGAGLPMRTDATCQGGGGQVDSGLPPVPESAKCFRMLAHNGDKKTKYKVGRANDSYMNMSFAAPWGAETRYAISMRPVIDNAAVIHHWLLFDEPGIDGAVLPGTGAHPGGQLLTGWAPGGDGVDLIGNPDDVGYEMRGGGTYVLEIHYNSTDPNAEDASGVEICMMDHKPKNIAALSWLGWDHLGFGAQRWWGNCKPLITTPIHIVAVTPHMHLDGARMRGIINRANGTKETLHDLAFDFNYQQSYKKDVVLNAGDTITTDCWFKKPQSFGEATTAEMCYLFTYAYPKGALADVSAWGAVAHGGSACMSEGGTRGALDP